MDFKTKARKFEMLSEIMENLAQKAHDAQELIDNHFSGPIGDLDYYDRQRRMECETIIAAAAELMSELTVKYK